MNIFKYWRLIELIFIIVITTKYSNTIPYSLTSVVAQELLAYKNVVLITGQN